MDEKTERFVVALQVNPSNSIVRYCEGNFNEKLFIKGDGNSTLVTVGEIISLSKIKYSVDDETTGVLFNEQKWSDYMYLCKEFRKDSKIPALEELQNEEIVSKDGYVKSDSTYKN